MQFVCNYNSPLGDMLLAEEDGQLVGIWFCDAKRFGSTLQPNATAKITPVLQYTMQWLDGYFKGKNLPLPPIKFVGTPFQKTVWNLLLQIPYGTTVTYGNLAKKLQNTAGFEHSSARAVGGAVGRNPISIVVPCHRVVGVQGLVGFDAGLPRKEKLLLLEQTGSLRG